MISAACQKLSLFIMGWGFLLGGDVPEVYSDMKIIKIRWQRLVAGGKTCLRCGSTEKELRIALSALRRAFAPLGIKVILKKDTLSLPAFKKNPSLSNRIWINSMPLEAWINAKAGQTQCCDVCGDSECRTVEVKGNVYETIPSKLIIKACLVAASQL